MALAADELRLLSTARADQFAVERLLGVGHSGMVVSARCTRDELADRGKRYAVKLLFNFTEDYSSLACNAYENEWLLLSRVLPHRHIVRLWGQFISTIPDSFLELAPPIIASQAARRAAGGKQARRKGQFLVLDYHPATLLTVAGSLSSPQLAIKYSWQLLSAVEYLYSDYRVCHLDIKLSNILLSEQGDQLVLCDFGCAVQFTDRHFILQWRRGEPVGGNKAHLSPEVLTAHHRCRSSGRGNIDYRKQPSFAVGVLLYELITGEHPLPDYPLGWTTAATGEVSYTVEDISTLPGNYPRAACSMVEQLLHPDPVHRLSLSSALHKLTDELQQPAITVGRNTLKEEKELAQAQLVVLAAERDFAVHEMRAMAEHCQTVASEFEQLARHCEVVKEQLEEARRERNDAVSASEAAFEVSEALRDKLQLTTKEKDIAKAQVEELRDITTRLQVNQSICECCKCNSFYLLEENTDTSCCLHNGVSTKGK